MPFAVTREHAWQLVDAIFPSNYIIDVDSTCRAGFPIYRSPDDRMDYVCDLGSHLEVNLHHGNTINICIEKL